MGRLPPRSTEQVSLLLAHFGFRLDHPGKGHDIWLRERDGRAVSVPRNRRSGEIPVGTVKSILLQAGITREEAIGFWEGRSAR
jgi:predicted RNA binding protein YcfA (HicA-like mRNA interferase family)